MKYIDIKIESLEDLKITDSIQGNDEGSIDYISGSVIRGAFIRNYIKHNNIKNIDENQKTKKMFFEGGIKFLNGYIELLSQRTLPLYKGVYIEDSKKEIYLQKGTVPIKNEINEKIEEGFSKVKGSKFGVYTNKEIKEVNVEKVYNLHIKKGKEKSMFRYEALKAGQVFRSLILVEDEYVEEVREVIENGDFYIGGSKGSGYGKVKIEIYEELEKNPEEATEKEFGDEIIIQLLSNGVFLDRNLNLINYIDEDELRDKLGLEDIRLIDIVAETTKIGTFNNKWRSRTQQYNGIEMGSIFKYKIKGKINNTKKKELENEGIGLKREEGLGRIRILSSLKYNSIEKNEGIRFNSKERIILNKDEKEQLQNIVNKIARRKIEDKIEENSISISSSNSEIKENQIGKLVKLFENAKLMNKVDGVSLITEYIKGLDTRRDGINKINTNQNQQLRELEIDNINSIAYIEKAIKNLEEKDILKHYGIKNLKLENIRVQLSEETLYRYRMMELENIFRYILRRRK